MIAALKSKGETNLKCLPSRDHTELMFKNVLKVPMQIKKKRICDATITSTSKSNPARRHYSQIST